MNTEALRALIVELRDKENLTYQAIADFIGEKYGVVRTRQSIQGIYRRAVSQIESTSSTEDFLLEADIKNLMALGYFITEIQEALSSEYPEVTYNKVRDIVADKKEEIDAIRQGIKGQVSVLMANAHFYKELEEQIRYKKWPIKERALKKYVKAVYKDEIESKVREELRKLEGFMGDSAQANQLRGELKRMDF